MCERNQNYWPKGMDTGEMVAEMATNSITGQQLSTLLGLLNYTTTTTATTTLNYSSGFGGHRATRTTSSSSSTFPLPLPRMPNDDDAIDSSSPLYSSGTLDPFESLDIMSTSTTVAAAAAATETFGSNQTTWSLLLTALFYKLDDGFDINWFNFILAIILVMLMLTTAIGNLFVIVAILIERNLRTIGNYLVLSLAIADLLVACLVMPLAGIYQILERWTLGVLLCDIWTSADVFCCTG